MDKKDKELLSELLTELESVAPSAYYIKFSSHNKVLVDLLSEESEETRTLNLLNSSENKLCCSTKDLLKYLNQEL